MPRRDLSADATWDMSEEEERRSVLVSSLRVTAAAVLIPLLALIAFGIYVAVRDQGHDAHLERLDDQVVSHHPDGVLEFGSARFSQPCDPSSGAALISVSRRYLTGRASRSVLAYYSHLLRTQRWDLQTDRSDTAIVEASRSFGSWSGSIRVAVEHHWLKVKATTLGCTSPD